METIDWILSARKAAHGDMEKCDVAVVENYF